MRVLLTLSSLPRLLEISQIGRRMVLLGRHQKPIPAHEIVFLADGDLRVVFGIIKLYPVRTRIRVVHVTFVDSPRPRQSMVDRCDFVMKDVRRKWRAGPMQTTTPPITFDPAARGPLHGVRILDLSRLVAGNMLSLQLADFGADVIKVGPPGGDPLRDWRDGGHELHWKVYARNKRSIVLNLHHDRARMALVRLAAMADVFIENFRPGTLEKMGLGPDALLRANPDLIIVRVSGFGRPALTRRCRVSARWSRP
jgi:CoA-transferase family III